MPNLNYLYYSTDIENPERNDIGDSGLIAMTANLDKLETLEIGKQWPTQDKQELQAMG